jgi:translation initiation factor IF-2
MSRIRVYDLAKEAGMVSKELADKLIDLGYNIKGHSSTVDDDVADEIRRNVLGTAETEVVEKRISTKGHTTIIRRRSQTVRRAPEPVPAAEEKVETSGDAIEEIEKQAPKKKAAKKKKEEDAVAAAVAEDVLEAESASITSTEEPKAALEEPEAEKPAEEAEPQEKAEEQPVDEAEKEKEEKPKPKVIKRIVPPRKGLAKVIKKAAIQVPEEKPKAPARPARPARQKKGEKACPVPFRTRGTGRSF